MSVPAPHFLLYSRAMRAAETDESGRWSFTLQSTDGSHSMRVEDAEPDAHGERLELLALVRGLEAVPQPAQVTLVTSCPRVNRVLTRGLDDWRSNNWRWERHGEMVPVKNADLWQRIDRALGFHQVDCRPRHSDGPRVREPQSHPSRFDATSIGRGCLAGRGLDQRERPTTEAIRRKSWADKVLLLGTVARSRLRHRLRRWRTAVVRLQQEAADT